MASAPPQFNAQHGEVPVRVDTAIVWFRRDVRLYDNPALCAALQAARTVIPVFVWAPEEEGQFQPGRQTRWWTKQTVGKLAGQLAQMGSRLVVRRSLDSISGLRELAADSGAQAVFFNHLYDSISMMRDNTVKDELRAHGIYCDSFNADVLYEPWEVLDDDRQPYTTFKSYWQHVLQMPYPPPLPLPEPLALPPVPAHVASLDLNELDWFMTPEQEASTDALAHRWQPGTEGAHARLEVFLAQALPTYEHDRAKTDRESTTTLSPWIHFGAVSVRYIYYRVAQLHAEAAASGKDLMRSCMDFLQQLGYREYSRYLSFHFPFITERSMLAHLRACPFRRDANAFKAWRQGLTGYPLIDAGMRQLWATGWCHNRVRVVAASFLVKHLLLPWQWGLKHLWDCQVDADLECDALGWQYVAGCLADAHPFSYMIDLETEWKRFDPTAEYVRRWLPVLARLPPEWAHQPWKAPDHVLADAGVELGFNYPLPLISMDAAKDSVKKASSIIERCTSSKSGTTSGHSSGSVLPRKEPYRPPTDPALLAALLGAAAEEFAGWDLREGLTGLELLQPSEWTSGMRSGSFKHRHAHRTLSGGTYSSSGDSQTDPLHDMLRPAKQSQSYDDDEGMGSGSGGDDSDYDSSQGASRSMVTAHSAMRGPKTDAAAAAMGGLALGARRQKRWAEEEGSAASAPME